MDYKKIIKKSESSLFSLIVSMLLVIGVFVGLFMWINTNAEKQGVTMDSKYNTTYTTFQNASDDIESSVNDITSKAKEIREADNLAQVAWNGLRGLGSLLLLPLDFIDSGQTLLDASTTQISGIIPSWTITLLRIAIIAFIVLLVVWLLMGGGRPI